MATETLRIKVVGLRELNKVNTAVDKLDKKMRAINKSRVTGTTNALKVLRQELSLKNKILKADQQILKVRNKQITSNKKNVATQAGKTGGGGGKSGGGGGVLSSALISGAFPLLFGQGLLGGAVGAIGGGVGAKFGGQMGGFAGGLVATAALQQITTAIAAISELGQALGPFVQDTEAVTTALGLQGTAEGERIRLIEETQGKTAAFNAAMQVMSGQIGEEGVTALRKFGESTQLLNTQFTLALTKLQAFAAGIANFVIRITGLRDKLEAGAAQDTVAAAAAGGDEQAQALVERRKAAESMKGQGGEGNRKRALLNQISAEEKIFAIRRNASIEADTFTEKLDALGISLKAEAEETKRIAELRKQGLNPALAKTIAGIEKEGKLTKDNLQVEIDKLLEKQAKVGQLEEKDQIRLTTLEKTRNEIDGQVDGLINVATATDKVNQGFDKIAKSIQNDIKEGIKGLIKGTSTLGDMLNNIADKFLDIALNQALFGNIKGDSITGGLFKFLGFANGGRPPVGKPSIVGEKGPELFVPRSSGTIVPNNKLGGGGSTSVVVNVDASGSDVQGDDAAGQEFGTLIAAAVQGELVKQQRPGGLLNR